MKKSISILLAVLMILTVIPSMSLTAYAAGGSIDAAGGKSVTISSDQTCTTFSVYDGSTLTVNQGVTLTLSISNSYSFDFFDNSTLQLHGTLAGSVASGATWMDNTYINVYLSDGAKYTVTGLSCMDGDNYLRYYGYDAATDGNGTVSVKNGTTDVTSTSTGYKTTTYTFTATPASGYRFVNWTKGAGGEVLGTDASINVTCEQNGQYQVYANFEEDAPDNTTTVSYDVQPTYTVAIPAAVTLGDADVTADITASNVILEDGSQITVTLSAASNTASGSTFNAKNGDSTVTYTITGDSAIAVGDTVATFTANGSKTLTFSAADKSAATAAGSHTETLTFTISA